MRRPPEGAWARHFQDAWHDDSLNPKFPKALRVAFLAYGTHRANGHARFKTGEIAKVLSRVDETGTLIPAAYNTVHRAITTAIELGLLDKGSTSLCLIVPNHRISGGVGDADDPCDRHDQPARRRRKTSLKAVS